MYACISTITLYYILSSQVNDQVQYLIGPRVEPQDCHLNYLTVNGLNPLVFIIALPAYELLIYPLIHKYILPMTKRVGIGFGLGLLAVLATLLINVLIHMKHSKLTCSFYTTEDMYHIHNLLPTIPILVSSFAEMLVFIPGKL